MKDAALNLLLVIITAVDNINQNTLFEYLMLTDFFDSFITVSMPQHLVHLWKQLQIILDSSTSTSTAFNVILVLVIVANYQKYEAQNPYIKYISSLNDEKSLRVCKSLFNAKSFLKFYLHISQKQQGYR